MKTIFAFGDSVMKGIVSDVSLLNNRTLKYRVCNNNFVTQCESFLGQHINNLARFGSTILVGLKNMERYKSQISAGDYILLEFGGNDCNFDWAAISENPNIEHLPTTTIEDFDALYNQLIDVAINLGAHPVLLSLPVLDAQAFFDYVTRNLDADAILRWMGGDIARIQNWHEQYNLEVFKLASQRGIPIIDITSVFLKQQNLPEYFCVDGMHPNEKGHQLIADEIKKWLDTHELA